ATRATSTPCRSHAIFTEPSRFFSREGREVRIRSFDSRLSRTGLGLQAVPGERAAEIPHGAADLVAVADHLVERGDDPLAVGRVDSERGQQLDDVVVVAGN